MTKTVGESFATPGLYRNKDYPHIFMRVQPDGQTVTHPDDGPTVLSAWEINNYYEHVEVGELQENIRFTALGDRIRVEGLNGNVEEYTTTKPTRIQLPSPSLTVRLLGNVPLPQRMDEPTETGTRVKAVLNGQKTILTRNDLGDWVSRDKGTPSETCASWASWASWGWYMVPMVESPREANSKLTPGIYLHRTMKEAAPRCVQADGKTVTDLKGTPFLNGLRDIARKYSLIMVGEVIPPDSQRLLPARARVRVERDEWYAKEEILGQDTPRSHWPATSIVRVLSDAHREERPKEAALSKAINKSVQSSPKWFYPGVWVKATHCEGKPGPYVYQVQSVTDSYMVGDYQMLPTNSRWQFEPVLITPQPRCEDQLMTDTTEGTPTYTGDQIKAALAVLGIYAEDVLSLTMTPNSVSYIRLMRDPEGNLRRQDDGGALKQWIRIPIVSGDDGSDPVLGHTSPPDRPAGSPSDDDTA